MRKLIRVLVLLPLVWTGVVALGLIVSTTAHAEVHAYGVGARSCGKWLEDRRTGNRYDDVEWLLGWVSAAGQYRDAQLRHSDSAAMPAWVDNYCTANPLDPIYVGAYKLVEELSKPAS